MLALMAFGYRLEAISILGKNVMLPHGLVGLGYDSLKYCGREIAEALRAFLDPGSYGILVHCTQGKDRTGLIACLILLLLEVPLEAITYDYRLSEDELLPEREARVKEMATIGLTEEFAGCPVDWIEKMDVYLREKDGGVKGYLKGIGFGEEEQAELLRVLRA
jgi:protein-tyrosine phosphatase